MSLEAMVWATNDAPVIDTKEFAVLTVLADRAGPDGCDAFPAVLTIARRTRMSERSVQRALDALRQRSLIQEGDQSAARYLRVDRKPTVYDLMIPFSWFSNMERINDERERAGRSALTRSDRPDFSGCQAVTPEESDVTGHGVTVSPERGDTESFYGVSESHPNQSFKNRSEGTGNTHAADASVSVTAEVVDRVCKALADAIRERGVKRPKITYAWRDAARELLTPDEEGFAYTVEEIEGGITWAMQDKFWASRVPTMKKFAEHFGKIMVQARGEAADPTTGMGKQIHDDLMERRLKRMDQMEQELEEKLGRPLNFSERKKMQEFVDKEVQ